MAASRERRQHAGRKMVQLIEADDEDEFYKSTYGGFVEENDDNDFDTAVEPNAAAEDSFDSDFLDSSSSSDDDEINASEGEEKTKRRKKTIKKGQTTHLDELIDEDGKVVAQDSKDTAKKAQNRRKKSEDSAPIIGGEARTLRTKTDAARAEMQLKHANQQIAAASRHVVNKNGARRLTQEELLAAAKITEQENIESLKVFYAMEIEKRKRRAGAGRTKNYGPMVKFCSKAVPYKTGDSKSTNAKTVAHTVISFTDIGSFNAAFPPPRRLRPAEPTVCAVTRLPARYRDPLTGKCYATIEAFRAIRSAYERLHAAK